MVLWKKQLEDMGFMEISKDLFMKDMGEGVKIFRDYRNGTIRSYAYKKKVPVPIDLFKELRAIEKIEKYMTANISAFS
jgi:hypothetical protein